MLCVNESFIVNEHECFGVGVNPLLPISMSVLCERILFGNENSVLCE
jgi:hypothetical protein